MRKHLHFLLTFLLSTCFITLVIANPVQEKKKYIVSSYIDKENKSPGFRNNVTDPVVFPIPFFDDLESSPIETWDVIFGTDDPMKDFTWDLLAEWETGEAVPGHSGSYYLVSLNDTQAPRNEWAITPRIELEANTSYTFSLWAFLPGENDIADEFEVRMFKTGVTQEEIFVSPVIIDVTGENAIMSDEWTLFSAEFTPETDGAYRFAIHHCTSVPNAGAVGFDDIIVEKTPQYIPEADLELENTDIEFGGVVKFINKSENNPIWSFYKPYLPIYENMTTIDNNEEFYCYYPVAGTFDVSLEVGNSLGSTVKVINNAITVSEKAYSDLPYDITGKTFNDPYDLYATTGWNKKYDENKNETYLVPSTLEDMVQLKCMYLENGKEYTFTANIYAVGGIDVQVYLLRRMVIPELGIMFWGIEQNLGIIMIDDKEDGEIKSYAKSFKITGNDNYMIALEPGGVVYENPNGKPFEMGLASYKIEEGNLSGVSHTETVSSYPFAKDRIIYINEANNQPISVFTIEGRKIYQADNKSKDEISVQEGIYIVKVGNKTNKIIVK